MKYARSDSLRIYARRRGKVFLVAERGSRQLASLQAPASLPAGQAAAEGGGGPDGRQEPGWQGGQAGRLSAWLGGWLAEGMAAWLHSSTVGWLGAWMAKAAWLTGLTVSGVCWSALSTGKGEEYFVPFSS